MASEADRVRRAAAELKSNMGLLLLPDGSYTSSGRCAEEALRHHGASVSKATRSFGIRPSEVWRASGGDPTKLVGLLNRHADQLDRQGVTPQKPKEEPKPKKVRTPRPQATQRPGVWARPTRKPAPLVSKVPRTKGSSNMISVVGLALAALFVLGVVVQHGVAILTAITTALTIAALAAIAVGLAWMAWSTRDADVWQRIRLRLAQRRAARVELEQRRTEWAELIERDSQPIALGPATTVDTVSTTEHAELMKRWTPGTHVPELAPRWRR